MTMLAAFITLIILLGICCLVLCHRVFFSVAINETNPCWLNGSRENTDTQQTEGSLLPIGPCYETFKSMATEASFKEPISECFYCILDEELSRKFYFDPYFRALVMRNVPNPGKQVALRLVLESAPLDLDIF